MQEPPFAVRRIHDGALVGAVDGGRAGLQHDTALVGAVKVLGAQHRLPAAAHAAFRDAQVIPVAEAVDLGAFRRRAGVDRDALVQQFPAVRGHPVQDDGTGALEAVAEVGLAVLIPEGAGVFPAGNSLDAVQGRPGPGRIFRRAHEQALVRRAEIHPEAAVVPADAGRPGASGVMRILLPSGEVEAPVDLGDEPPADQVLGLQDLHAHKMKIGGDHIVRTAHADDVRIGIVGRQDRIAVAAVTGVAPGIPVGDRTAAGCEEQKARNQRNRSHLGRGFPSLICW